MKEIVLDEIISKNDLKNGGVILLTGRPAVGKTKTCAQLFKKNLDYAFYIDLADNAEHFISGNKNFSNTFLTSVEVVKKIEELKSERKIFFIDGWENLNDKNDWFIQKLLCITYAYKLVVIITATLCKNVEKRKNHLPKIADFKGFGSLNKATKIVVLNNLSRFDAQKQSDETKYFLYKDIYSENEF